MANSTSARLEPASLGLSLLNCLETTLSLATRIGEIQLDIPPGVPLAILYVQ